MGNFFNPINRHNNVHLPETENIQKVLTIGFNVESIAWDKIPAQVAKWNVYNANDLSDINLNDEWLLRFGMELQSGYLSNLRTASLKGFRINTYKNEDLGFWWLGLYHNSKNNHIKYVHQLQNLYFALTGEELTLKN